MKRERISIAAVLAGDRLIGVAQQVVEDLLELVGVEVERRHVLRQVERHLDAARGQLRLQQLERLGQDRLQLVTLAPRHRRPDRLQELAQDRVEPPDLAARGVEVI